MPFIIAQRDSWSSWWHFLLQRLALCSGSWSQTTFSTMVCHWLLLRFSLSQVLISAAESDAEHISITGYYHHDIEFCTKYNTPAYAYIWAPWFSFDAILAVLAIWAGVKHSRQQSNSHSARLNKPWLVSVLIQGNVIYFLGWALSCHHWIESDPQGSPLGTFIFYMQRDMSLEVQWLAEALVWSVPVPISVGCHLILSIREAASSHDISSVSSRTMSAFVARDGSWNREGTSTVWRLLLYWNLTELNSAKETASLVVSRHLVRRLQNPSLAYCTPLTILRF